MRYTCRLLLPPPPPSAATRKAPSETMASCMAAGWTVKTLLAPRNPSRRSQKSHQKQQPPPVSCDVVTTRIFTYWKVAGVV